MAGLDIQDEDWLLPGLWAEFQRQLLEGAFQTLWLRTMTSIQTTTTMTILETICLPEL